MKSNERVSWPLNKGNQGKLPKGHEMFILNKSYEM